MKDKKTTHVFFDLDGTLLDTAADLAYAINQVLHQHGRNPVVFADFRYYVHGGSTTMLCHGFNIDEQHPNFPDLKKEFLNAYRQNLTQHTTFFPGMETVLQHLDQNNITWGIVTNKPAWLTDPLLAELDLDQRSACIISGDTLPQRKPHPAPIEHACQLTQTHPTKAVYIGDTKMDAIAAKAAGMPMIAASYGYHAHNSLPHEWGVEQVIDSPLEIIDWINRRNHSCKNL